MVPHAFVAVITKVIVQLKFGPFPKPLKPLPPPFPLLVDAILVQVVDVIPCCVISTLLALIKSIVA